MGKKSSPSQPAAPDPAATAAAQQSLNNSTALFNAGLNRINTYSPYGSQTYDHTAGKDSNDPGVWSTNISLSPAEQALFDKTNSVNSQALDLANSQIKRVGSTLSSDFAPAMTSLSSGIRPDAGPVTSTVAPTSTQVTDKIAPTKTAVTDTYGSGGAVQHGLDFSGAPALVGGQDLASQQKAVSDAIYGQAKQNLDPQYAQEENKVADDLVNRGIAVGSPAYDTAMSNFRQSRDNAYATAQQNATLGGVSAANTLFGQGLAARQQDVGETTTQGQFTNTAQALAEQEAAARGAFQNAAQGQEFGQNTASAAFQNAAQGQEYGQNLSTAGFQNAAQAQDYGQQTNTQLTNANLGNQEHQIQYSEALNSRELPINETAALLGLGPGVQAPTAQATPVVSSASPNYEGDVNSAYAQQLAAYNASNQANASTMGGLFGALGGIGGGLASATAKPWIFSDSRLKRDIALIGRTAKGLGVYSFQYLGSTIRQIGLIAQEVERITPAAVRMIGGYRAVNYALALAGEAV